MTYIGCIMTTLVLNYYLNHQELLRKENGNFRIVRQISWIFVGILTHVMCLSKYGYQTSYFGYYTITMVLLVLAIIDGQKLEIPMDLLWVSAAIGILLLLTSHSNHWYLNILSAIGTYFVMILLFKVLRGGLGEGDVYIMVIIALFFGWVHALLVFLLALVISGLIGIILLVLGRAHKKSVLPFVPFIALVQFGLLLV